jgi:hypothetical protein
LIKFFDRVEDAHEMGIFIFSLPSINIKEGANRIRFTKKTDAVAPLRFFLASRSSARF